MNSMILFAQAAQEAAKPAAQQSGMGMLVPMLLIFAIFYFMNHHICHHRHSMGALYF